MGVPFDDVMAGGDTRNRQKCEGVTVRPKDPWRPKWVQMGLVRRPRIKTHLHHLPIGNGAWVLGPGS